MIEITLSAADVAILYRLAVEELDQIFKKTEYPLDVNLAWLSALVYLKNKLENYLKIFHKEIEELENEPNEN